MKSQILPFLVKSFKENFLAKATVFLERISYIIAVAVGVAGVVMAVLSPWPVSLIAEKFSLNLLGARLILALSLSVTISIIVMGILLIPRRKSALSSGVPVSTDVVYSWLLNTLSAFENSLAVRVRELDKEHELTRSNLRYHRKQVRELINLGLLDCEAPWLLYSGGDLKWQPYLAERKNIDSDLREIYNTLRRPFIPAKYNIALAVYKARRLQDHVKKALEKLRQAKETLSETRLNW